MMDPHAMAFDLATRHLAHKGIYKTAGTDYQAWLTAAYDAVLADCQDICKLHAKLDKRDDQLAGFQRRIDELAIAPTEIANAASIQSRLVDLDASTFATVHRINTVLGDT